MYRNTFVAYFFRWTQHLFSFPVVWVSLSRAIMDNDLKYVTKYPWVGIPSKVICCHLFNLRVFFFFFLKHESELYTMKVLMTCITGLQRAQWHLYLCENQLFSFKDKGQASLNNHISFPSPFIMDQGLTSLKAR